MNIQALSQTLAATLVFWCLYVIDVLVLPLPLTKWSSFSANISEVLCLNLTEIFVPGITVCLMRATMALRYNMACFKTSQCIMSTFFILPDGDEQSNDGFSCWSTHACLYGHQLVDEGAKITVMDACVGYRTMVCTRQGMVYTDAPARRTACTAPFTPYSFGCMYLPEDYTGMHCEARHYCESLGSQFASPATHEDVKAMTAYFTQLYGGSRMIHLGLRLLGGTWRWPSNLRDPGSFGTGDWHETQPDPSGRTAMMSDHDPGEYSVGDYFMDKSFYPLCHVWNIQTSSRCR